MGSRTRTFLKFLQLEENSVLSKWIEYYHSKYSFVPYVIGTTTFVTGLKAILEWSVEWPGMFEFGDWSVFLTLSIFICGFILNGTLADFKEAERLPGELASIFDAVDDSIQIALTYQPYLKLEEIKIAALELQWQTHFWITSEKTKIDNAKISDSLNKFSIATRKWVLLSEPEERAKAQPARNYVQADFRVIAQNILNLRRMLGRISIMSSTGFLPIGHMLLNFILLLIASLLLCTKWKLKTLEFTLVSFITAIFSFIVFLVHDVDDPFDFQQRHRLSREKRNTIVPEDETFTRDNIHDKRLEWVHAVSSTAHLLPLEECFARHQRELIVLMEPKPLLVIANP